MTNHDALAAGQGGTQSNDLTSEIPRSVSHRQTEETQAAPPQNTPTVAPASRSLAPAAKPAAARNEDDAYRKITVQDLATALNRSNTLLARCQAMTDIADLDQLGPIHAAARLMNAQAQVAKALALAAQVERRSRTIIETIQRPDPENAGLNSIFSQGQNSSPEQRKKIRDVLERALLQFLEEQKQNRERREDGAIGSAT